MIYEALLVPYEYPLTARELKRALLTYDKVVVIEPSDQELIPRNAIMLAMGMPPVIGIDMGPIRPQGRVEGYVDSFSRVIEEADDAVRQGLVEVRSTFQQQSAGQMTLGSIPTGGYPLNIRLVFWLYRSMANDAGFLRDAICADQTELIRSLATSENLALSGKADGKINDSSALPELEGMGIDSHVKSSLTQVARARLGAVVKYAGFCEAKNLVPMFPSQPYGAVIERLLNNAAVVMNDGVDDKFWTRRNRALELCHEEFLVEERLDGLTFKEALKLRTKAWGRQAEAREGLFESVFRLSTEIGDSSDFDSEAKKRIGEYRKTSDDLVLERRKLGLQIKCDIGKGVLGGGVVLTGLVSQLASPAASIGLTLAAGGMWAFDKAKSYVPQLMDLKAKESEMRRGAGFGMHDFYSRLG